MDAGLAASLRSGRSRAGGEPCAKLAMPQDSPGGRAWGLPEPRLSGPSWGPHQIGLHARPPPPRHRLESGTPSGSPFAPTCNLPLVTPEAEELIKAERLPPASRPPPPAPSGQARPCPPPAHSSGRAGHTLGLRSSSGAPPWVSAGSRVRGTGRVTRRLCSALPAGGPVPMARVRRQEPEGQPRGPAASQPATTEPAHAGPVCRACPRPSLGPRGQPRAPGSGTAHTSGDRTRWWGEVSQSK